MAFSSIWIAVASMLTVFDITKPIDDNGNVIIKIPRAKEKKGIKRKKNLALLSGVAEATSPLQSIHWFRVVLDEAQ